MAALLAGSLAGCADKPTAGRCNLAHVSDLPLHRRGGHVLIDAMINGLPSRLIFDTGAFTSVITPEAATRLHLSMERPMAGEGRGIGGSQSFSIMEARTVQLGVTSGRNFSFTSSDLGPARNGFGADGLLSSDLFSKWDIDLDFPANRISLFLPIGACGTPSAFLGGELYQVPLLPFDNDRRPRIHVTIGGKDFTALIDTGADSTVIYRAAAARLGLYIADLATDRHGSLSGIGRHPVRAVEHVFEPVTIGDLTVVHMPIKILDQAKDEPVDILLGEDFQSRVHLWISYSSNALIMQYPPLPSPAAPL